MVNQPLLATSQPVITDTDPGHTGLSINSNHKLNLKLYKKKKKNNKHAYTYTFCSIILKQKHLVYKGESDPETQFPWSFMWTFSTDL